MSLAVRVTILTYITSAWPAGISWSILRVRRYAQEMCRGSYWYMSANVHPICVVHYLCTSQMDPRSSEFSTDSRMGSCTVPQHACHQVGRSLVGCTCASMPAVTYCQYDMRRIHDTKRTVSAGCIIASCKFTYLNVKFCQIKNRSYNTDAGDRATR